MRAVLGIVSLLVVLALVGLLTRKNLDATRTALPALQTPAAAGQGASAPVPTGNVREQSQQIQQQYKKALESAMNQPRPEPAD